MGSIHMGRLTSTEGLGGRRASRVMVLQPGQDCKGIFEEVGLTIPNYVESRWEPHSICQVVGAQLTFCLGELCPFFLYFGGEVWK